MSKSVKMSKVYTSINRVFYDRSSTPYLDARRACIAECTPWLLEALTGKIAGIRLTEHAEMHDDGISKMAVCTAEVWEQN